MSGHLLDARFEADFKPFILRESAALAAYDNQRPAGHAYPFPAHVQRVANDMRALAVRLNLSSEVQEALYWVSLVHDAGKRSLPHRIWDTKGKPSERIRAQRRRHTLLGVDIVNEAFGADDHHPFLDLMRDLMAHHHETLDGSGWLGLKDEALSFYNRMLCVCDAFDGYSVWRPHFGKRDLSQAAVFERMMTEKKGQFDAPILDAFMLMKADV